ncbi:MAG TPA: hypothetical protein VMV92_34375 [Streptosporangiaceae bacterium]|nr:hypothetical protein [Streptosporangiaceae bacterium]
MRAAIRPRQVRDALGIRWIDVFAAVVVAALVELDVAVGGGPGASRLDAVAYLLGAVLAVPVLFRCPRSRPARRARYEHGLAEPGRR